MTASPSKTISTGGGDPSGRAVGPADTGAAETGAAVTEVVDAGPAATGVVVTGAVVTGVDVAGVDVVGLAVIGPAAAVSGHTRPLQAVWCGLETLTSLGEATAFEALKLF